MVERKRRREEANKREKTSRRWAYLAGQVDEQVGNQAATATGSDSASVEVGGQTHVLSLADLRWSINCRPMAVVVCGVSCSFVRDLSVLMRLEESKRLFAFSNVAAVGGSGRAA
jgi:hypothetical protein